MVLSKNFIKDYTPLNISIDDLANKMLKIGNEYDKKGKMINATNLIIGEVISCENHPQSDHLHLCEVNIGSEVLNIICGAPNVKKGIRVIVALDGAVLPGVTIKKTKILGYESNGMICSLGELGIENKYLKEEDVKGIQILENDALIGSDPIKYLNLDDEIIDFELTSNRADLLSMLGLAYETCAITGDKVTYPSAEYKCSNCKIDNILKLNVGTDNCYAFLIKRVDSISINDSPSFIKNRLIACGIRPINNIVDISNYVMLETGQPLHFYDADKLGKVIGVRMAKDGEIIKTLDGQERSLVSKDIVIVNENNEAIGLAGVMGGYSTKVDENTKNIVIEAAIFNPYCIRYTAIKHLRSEASNRFEKGLDVNRTFLAIERSCSLLESYASGSVNDGILEYNTLDRNDKEIEISLDKINKVLGLTLESSEVLNVFEKLDFKTIYIDGVYKLKVPTRRVDISIEEDLIEEVGRIYGVDNIQSKLPYFESIVPVYDNKIRAIKDKLCSLGLSETITYSLINEKNIYKFTSEEFDFVKVNNPMNEEREVLRYSLINSLLDVFDYNKSRGIKDLSIFEIGNGFSLIDENYIEEKKASGLLIGKFNTGINNENVDFYILKGIVEELLDYLGYKNRYSFVSGNLPKEMHPSKSLCININGKNIGFIGAVHPNIVKDEVYVFEINLNSLFDFKTGKLKYKEYSKYPGVYKDLAFVVEKDINSEDIINTIIKNGGKYLKNVNVFDYYEGNNIGENKKSIAYSLMFESYEGTLTESEITLIIDKIINGVIQNHKAILRDK